MSEQMGVMVDICVGLKNGTCYSVYRLLVSRSKGNPDMNLKACHGMCLICSLKTVDLDKSY